MSKLSYFFYFIQKKIILKYFLEILKINNINRTFPNTIHVSWNSSLTEANYTLICLLENIQVKENFTKGTLEGNCSFNLTLSGQSIKVKLLAIYFDICESSELTYSVGKNFL